MAQAAIEAEDGAAEGASGRKGLAALLTLRNIIILAVAVVLIGGGAAAYFMGFFGGGGEHAADAKKPEPPKPAFFLDMPDMVVNLNSPDKRAQYLKIRVALEISDAAAADLIKPYLPRVVDAFQIYLREIRTNDLEGSAGMYRLKEELQRRINTTIAPQKVDGVLFREILIQ